MSDSWCGNAQHTHAFLFGYMEGSVNGAKRLSQVRADLDHCKVLLADHARVCCARFSPEAEQCPGHSLDCSLAKVSKEGA